jgi:hypothetical protein
MGNTKFINHLIDKNSEMKKQEKLNLNSDFKISYDYLSTYCGIKPDYIGHTNTASNRVFESGSQRDNDTDKPLPSHLDAYVRLRYGYLLRMGANHYEKGNWKKGQPTETAIESLHRHLAKFEINLENGVEQDEDHLSAIIFNVQLIMKNEQKEGISVDNYYKK